MILKQADEIGLDATRLCKLLFAIEGRVGQRKLWGIVQLADHYPSQIVNAACAQALDDSVHSYKHIKAITEQLVAQALRRMDSAQPASDQASRTATAQAHHLIRSPQEYGELFAMASACTSTESTSQGDLFA